MRLRALWRGSDGGAMFGQQTKPRAGAQTKLFDEKVLVAGESRRLRRPQHTSFNKTRLLELQSRSLL